MVCWNLTNKFTQGDCIKWSATLPGYSPNTVSCFIRGQSNPLDLTAVGNGDLWDFEITEAQSLAFDPGKYQAQLVIFAPDRKTVCNSSLEILPSLESLASLETRSSEEIELDLINIAIATLANKGIAEYYIGIRRVRYTELNDLYARQAYLKNRLAKRKNKSIIGGRNVGAKFCNG